MDGPESPLNRGPNIPTQINKDLSEYPGCLFVSRALFVDITSVAKK